MQRLLSFLTHARAAVIEKLRKELSTCFLWRMLSEASYGLTTHFVVLARFRYLRESRDLVQERLFVTKIL